MEDFTATRPSAVIVLDLESEAEILARIGGRVVDMATGTRGKFRPPPPSGARGDDEITVDVLPGDRVPGAVAARLESYRSGCDGVVRSFALTEGAGEGGGVSADPEQKQGEGGGEGVFQWDSGDGGTTGGSEGGRHVPQEGVVAFFRSQEGGAFGRVSVLDATEAAERQDPSIRSLCPSSRSILDRAVSAVDTWLAADQQGVRGLGDSDDDGSSSSAALAAMPPNAFAVTLFCLESRLESRAADFLPHAFLLYPDRDYCVLTLPSVGAESVLLRHFSPLPARPGSAFSHVLYVMHRDSLPAYKYMRVSRFVGSSHRAGVSHLVECWGGADLVMAAVKEADQHQSQELIDNPPSAAFVATMGHQVVGVFVANREACGGDEVSRIRSEFEVDDFILYDRHRPRNQAVLTALALNPIFAGHCRFALKEVMRLYDKSVIYWRSTPASDLPKSVPWHMIPVKPRHQMQPQPGDVPPTYTGGGGRKRIDNEVDQRWLREQAPWLCDLPKVTANRRVVVIGASSTALVCLEGLVFTPYLNLTSLTLVSPGGIPRPAATGAAVVTGDTTNGKAAEHRSSSDGLDGERGGNEETKEDDAPDAARMARMGLERHVRVVRSRMVHLDRENGAILLPDGSVVPYDILVLCTGLQDDTSRRLGLWAPGLNPADPGVPGFVSLDSPFLPSDVEKALAGAPLDAGVVVYASALKALCAAQGLMDRGVAASRITVVRPLLAGARTATPTTMPDVTAAAAVEDRNTAAGKGLKPIASSWSLGDEAGVRFNSEGGVAAAVFESNELEAHGSGDRERGGAKGKQSRNQQRQRQRGQKSPEKGETKKNAAKAIEKKRGATAGEVSADLPEGVEDDEDGEEEGSDRHNTIECSLLLCADTPNADPDVFRAANNSGLVYDGRLVVDPMFRTSDPAVLAGGTLTKFSRVHGGADIPRHEHFNAREVNPVGPSHSYLIVTVLRSTLIHAFGLCTSAKSNDSRTAISEVSRRGPRSLPAAAHGEALPLPSFERPRCVSGRLPGGLCYVRATLPPAGAPLKHRTRNVRDGGGNGEEKEEEKDSGGNGGGGGGDAVKSFTTGAIVVRPGRRDRSEDGEEKGFDATDERHEDGVTGDYCLVRVDSLDRVCDIIYCGRGAVEAKNLSKVVGVQLGYLQAKAAFERGEVSSWIDFFRRGTFSPLYHDRFPKLAEELREVLTHGDEAAANLISALNKGIDDGMADEWLSIAIRKAIGPGASELPPSTRKTVEARALEWVRRNRGLLPRLALPAPSHQQAAPAAGGMATGSGSGGAGITKARV
ncbi:unnamed protein product [Scytosiphon promiscuus]